MLEEDIDGTPMEPEAKGGKSGGRGAGFVPSRWETVDPDLVEAQAMTTSKWDTLEHHPASNNSMDDSQEEDSSNIDFRWVEDNINICSLSTS